MTETHAIKIALALIKGVEVGKVYQLEKNVQYWYKDNAVFCKVGQEVTSMDFYNFFTKYISKVV